MLLNSNKTTPQKVTVHMAHIVVMKRSFELSFKYTNNVLKTVPIIHNNKILRKETTIIIIIKLMSWVIFAVLCELVPVSSKSLHVTLKLS